MPYKTSIASWLKIISSESQSGSFHQLHPFSFPFREKLSIVPDLQVRSGHFIENGAEVGGNRKVSSIFKVLNREFRYIAMYFSTLDIIAHNKHAGSPSMIGSIGAILVNGPSKLGHGHDFHIILVCAHIGLESGDGGTQVVHITRECAGLGSLVEMGIPSATFGKSDLQTYIHFYQLRHLFQ